LIDQALRRSRWRDLGGCQAPGSAFVGSATKVFAS
jgi:hypothetical protein